MVTSAALPDQLREELSAIADPARAPKMQAYMKSAMPYLGVPATPARQAAKRLFAKLRYARADEWQADVAAIWDNAAYREEYYAAIELCGHRIARPFQTMAALPLYKRMIIEGAWWDVVDAISCNLLLPLLVHDRNVMSATMRQWAVSDNMWLRRSAILCQHKAKAEMDIALLYDCIEPSIGSKEFFLRKAIGWILREYARTDPDEVRRYVAVNRDRLSALSVREAMKHL